MDGEREDREDQEHTLIRQHATKRKREVRTLTYKELSEAEPYKWFRGARGAIFRVVVHDDGTYTRVYWKHTQSAEPPETVPQTITAFEFNDHGRRRR
jgi:hypothetical protein